MHFYKFIILIALPLIALTSLSGQSNNEKIRLLSSALRANDAGDMEATVRNLKELIKISPDDDAVNALLEKVNIKLEKAGKQPIRKTIPNFMAPEKKEIFLGIEGKVYGPYTLSEVKQFIREGRAFTTDLGWKEGLKDWIRLKKLL